MKSFILILFIISIFSEWGNAQIWYDLELLPDQRTYVISLVSDTTWLFPENLTSSAQITIKVPHGISPNSFVVSELTSLIPNTEWNANVRIDAPVEAPEWDYISFALISLGTDDITYNKGRKTPLFSFVNGANSCSGSIFLIDNQRDVFLPPNSAGANITQSITILGGGLNNAYRGFVGTGRAPCTPITNCQADTIFQFFEICKNETLEGITYTTDTLVNKQFTSSEGCDSLVQIQITVLPTYETFQEYTICVGEELDGVIYAEEERQILNLRTSQGCDSIVYNRIIVLEPTNTTLDTVLCAGTDYNGITLFQDTIVQQVIARENSCDSIITTNVSVQMPPVNYQELIICEGMLLDGQEIIEDTVITRTYNNENLCDSVVITSLSVIKDILTIIDTTICQGEKFNGYTYSQDTVLLNTYKNQNQCDSIVETHLFVEQLTNQESTKNEYQIAIGASIPLELNLDSFLLDSIRWQPTEDLSCINCLEPIAKPTRSTTYKAMITTINGCTFSAEIVVIVNNELKIFVPNIFSPNGDGRNDLFYPIAGPFIEQILQFKIFDRFGSLVFQSYDFSPIEKINSWDGSFRGQQVSDGVYLYYVEALLANGKKAVKKGDFTLVR